MGISYEIRESLLSVLGPLPYLIILLSILIFSANEGTVIFLFIFSITVSFFYLLLAEAMNSIKSKLSQRKKSGPNPNKNYEGATYLERFINISREAFSDPDNDLEPITKHTNQPLFPYLVYSFWGFIISIFTFFISGCIFAWLVSRGHLDSMADFPVSANVIQNAPLGQVDLLLSLFPILNGLNFEARVLIGGVTFFTGFIFLSAARNLTKFSDEIHRRILRFLVYKNPLFKKELFNIFVLVFAYILLLYIM